MSDNPFLQDDLDPIINDVASSTGVPAARLRAVAEVESSLNPKATNDKSSAKGLMQLTDAAAKETGVDDPFDPRQNLLGGAKYLKKQYDRFGDWDAAHIAYHDGPGAYARSGEPSDAAKDYLKKIKALVPRDKEEQSNPFLEDAHPFLKDAPKAEAHPFLQDKPYDAGSFTDDLASHAAGTVAQIGDIASFPLQFVGGVAAGTSELLKGHTVDQAAEEYQNTKKDLSASGFLERHGATPGPTNPAIDNTVGKVMGQVSDIANRFHQPLVATIKASLLWVIRMKIPPL
jgi:hypothetical protein